MKTKTIIIGAVIVLGIIGLMWWGWGNQTADIPKDYGAASALLASEKLYDFGSISMKDGLVNHIFKITNSSDKDVLVKKIVTSCMCTEAYIESEGKEKGPFSMEGMGYVPPANETIKAGESRNVKVVYDPNAHGPAGVGAIGRLVYITDAAGGELQLEIKALVTP
ncbi:MAG: hypothetical protein A3G03_01305 [Candidatus Taylorbacteria bacterium RIFCSPLOWO2_12_FULL_44_15c]|uniref:DUF1573 domain-containing protein n=1 Tax=Candidatus Taylorbacteria bacterium RIFCSPLOWO2_12_FULL_44_15c TaxID=1802333 RepID=A0A1G2P528_9BACT|nr:MAG: hypothetical protein A3I97_03090 [Candidatus Taylorbacteria bacterium RIFCSPLOWO2_02_FULL_44_35]OHA43434.1 MAG: hypothetical protein A3G03_01305 [Candidatus Taylorbacteria bacterium RIFCSPLOWO2_12_FULL_44_15c]